MTRVLVSGSSGFVGKNLLELLIKKKDITIHTIQSSQVDQNNNLNIIQHKLPTSPSKLDKIIAEIKPNVFVHLAWKGIPNYNLENSIYSFNNTINIANACLKSGSKKLIVTGSCWEYLNPIGKIDEDWPKDNNNFFKASKNFSNNILELMCKEYNANLVWLRLFYVFGQYQNNHSLIPFLINQAKKGEEPIANNPYSLLDFVNAKDVSKVIYEAIIKRNFNGNYNVGSGRTSHVGDVVNKIRTSFGFDKIFIDKEKELSQHFYADIKKLKSKIEYSPSNILEDINYLVK